MRKKKAQSAVEFLSTYGWVLLILLAALGILMKYGFLEPGKYLPEKVEFGNQLVAEEYFMDVDANVDGIEIDHVVAIKFRNGFPRDINIAAMMYDIGDGEHDCQIMSADLESGDNAIFACKVTGLSKRTKNKITFKVKFSRTNPSAPPHVITGIVYAEPASGEYCTLEYETGHRIHEIDHNNEVC